jgi:hypothetical protein
MAPANSSGFLSLLKLTTSLLPFTNCMATAWVAKLPFFIPEPCVEVTQAPATEICGREARLCSAYPISSNCLQNSPYFIPPSTVTVLLDLFIETSLLKPKEEI